MRKSGNSSITDKQERLFFHFLRAGLGFGGVEVGFDVADDDWAALFKLSFSQAVQGVVADGVASSALRPSPPLWREWLAHLLHIEMMNEEMARCGEWMLGLLGGEGIEASVFKGVSVARWYLCPSHRCYGDIDIVVHRGWDKLKRVLPANGLMYFYENDDIIVEQLDGVFPAASGVGGRRQQASGRYRVEFHPAYETLYNPFMNARLKRIVSGRSEWWRGNVGASSVPHGVPEFYLACLILHLRRHVLSYGIGMKQVCDVAVMLRRAGLDMARLERLLRHLGAWRFSRSLFSFIETYLYEDGLPPTRRGGDTALLYSIFMGDGYVLKSERETIGGNTRLSPLRIAKNGWFWAKRSLRLFRLMPGEAFFFMFDKAASRVWPSAGKCHCVIK